MKVINPATEEIICELAEVNTKSIQESFSRAKKAQTDWRKVPVEERIAIMRKFKELLALKKETLSQTFTKETGKPITQSRNELSGVLERIRFFLDSTSNVMRDEVILNDSTNKLEERISHEPLGVITHISSWNYPFFIGSSVFVPALITGNAVLYKPSEYASLSGLAINDLLHEAGVPKDIFITLIGKSEVGREILKLPLHGVFFTGCSSTGQYVAQATAKRFIKTHLELDGNDAAYICEDVNLKETATAVAHEAFYNMGQRRCSVKRIYVHDRIYDAFLDFFMSTVKGFVVGDPTNEDTFIGPLAKPSQVDHIEDQVHDAVRKGGKLLFGGKKIKRKGNYFEPTVITQVRSSMAFMRTETFGPIVGIQKVSGDGEALELMNNTNYGMTASIYTLEKDRAVRLLSQINSGTVYWNCCGRMSPRLPWSGRGLSGLGTILSTYGIKVFLQPKAWHLKSIIQ